MLKQWVGNLFFWRSYAWSRSFLNHLTQGTTGHAEHGREVALTLLAAAEGTAPYQIKDVDKLYRIAKELEIETEELNINEVAKAVALKAIEDFQKQEETQEELKHSNLVYQE